MLQVMIAPAFMGCMKFMKKVRDEVARQNRKLAELGRMTGIPQQRFQDWDNPSSNRKPTLAQALAIAKALHVSLDYLADDEMTEVGDSFKLSRDEEVLIAFIRNADIEPRKALKLVMNFPKGLVATVSELIVATPEQVAEMEKRTTKWTALTVTSQSDPKPARPRRAKKKADNPKALPAPKKSDQHLHGKDKGSDR